MIKENIIQRVLLQCTMFHSNVHHLGENLYFYVPNDYVVYNNKYFAYIYIFVFNVF